MTSLPRLIIEAATAGGFQVVASRIRDCCGAVDYSKRLIVLNPECTDAQIEAEIGDQLRTLASPVEPLCVDAGPTERPPLVLVHSVDRPVPTPLASNASPDEPGSQVVG